MTSQQGEESDGVGGVGVHASRESLTGMRNGRDAKATAVRREKKENEFGNIDRSNSEGVQM